MSLSSLLEASAKGTLSSKEELASKDHAEEFKGKNITCNSEVLI
jgi:hypothetical protein